MSTRFVQALVLAAFCFIPSTALADGLLGSVTEKVTSTVKETVPLQRTEKSQDQSGQQNNDKAEPKDASLLGTVTGAVKETVKTVTKPIITVEKDKNAEEKSLVNINLSEDPSLKVDAKIAEASVSDSISVKTPVADAKVGDSIKVKTPVADVDVSDSISVKTPVVDAEVGDSIKVNTPVADVDVSDSISVKTPVVDAEVGDSIKVKTPAADIGAGDPIKVNTPTADNGRTDSISTTTRADTNIPDGMAAADTPANQTEPDSDFEKKSVMSDVVTDGLSQPEPLAADASQQFFGPSAITEAATSAEIGNKSNNDAAEKAPAEKPVQAAISYVPANSGTNGSSTTASGGQSAAGGAALPFMYFSGAPLLDAMSEKAARYGAVAFFHDQWLNAPPSQPPQKSFFLHVFI
ncbi:hypothetical protein [Bacillus infantis]|uniref:Uncharacterized protein n=1 Tax=Bacillus infantis TaxID=324767 RepID=A0A5D4RI69_9BACI|nr:hypothetical protein [Bacillus infantis]TYS50997.1 hypothetical protein FZD51_02835 [Bacillus infantis]